MDANCCSLLLLPHGNSTEKAKCSRLRRLEIEKGNIFQFFSEDHTHSCNLSRNNAMPSSTHFLTAVIGEHVPNVTNCI